jgi:hypothetical protein
VESTEERLPICERIDKYEHDRVTKQYMPKDGKANYHNTYIFTVKPKKGESFVFKVSHSPIDGHLESGERRFLRLEFNPKKVGVERMRAFRRMLCRLLGRGVVRRLWTEARVTRVDLAVDFKGLHESLWLYKTNARTSSIYRGKDSATQYLGGKRSRLLLRWYDKACEWAAGGRESGEKSWYRLEAEMRDLQCSPAELAETLTNPFSRVQFYSAEFLDDRFSKNQGLEEQFRRSVRELGLIATFRAKRVWEKGRERYLSWLEERGHRRHLFDPSDAWDGLGSALAVLDELWEE